MGGKHELSQSRDVSLRDFQRETDKLLSQGRSVLILAPTGFGKTRAAINPFCSRCANEAAPHLSTRLVYCAPLRALTYSIFSELKDLLGKYNHGQRVNPVVHHGAYPGSEFLSERAIVTTIDQYLTAFAGAPLSFSWRGGHAAAAAVLCSYSVYDEVHLLSPEKGLPLLAAMLRLRQRWGLLSTVMTGTLPSSVCDFFTNELGLTFVEPDAREVQRERDTRRKVVVDVLSKPVNWTDLVPLIERDYYEHGRVIVFVNRVRDAQNLWRELRQNSHLPAESVKLAHARYFPSDRERIDRELQEKFGRYSNWRGVLVTTQVAEAGLNISASAVYSQLSPIDSLLQRSGRCARFTAGGCTVEGRLVIFALDEDNPHVPYNKTIWERTRETVQDLSGTLTWQVEKQLVDHVLSEPYQYWVRGEPYYPDKKGKKKVSRRARGKGLTPGQALSAYEEAFRGRSPAVIENSLREMLNVKVVIYPISTHEDARTFLKTLEEEEKKPWVARRVPESVSLPLSALHGLSHLQHGIRRLYRSSSEKIKGMSQRKNRWQLISDPPIIPNGVYVLHPDDAGYTRVMGMTLQRNPGEGIGELTLLSSDWILSHSWVRKWRARDQSYVEHVEGTVRAAARIWTLYAPFISLWAEKVLELEDGKKGEDFSEALWPLVQTAVAFHDVGKLQVSWQQGLRKATEEGLRVDGPIARTAIKKARFLPSHANYAYILLKRVYEVLGVPEPFRRFIALASARHHTIGFNDTVGWQGTELVSEAGTLLTGGVLAQLLPEDELRTAVDRFLTDLSSSRSKIQRETIDSPSPADDFYLLYCVVNRIVKLADWEDAAGKEVELC